MTGTSAEFWWWTLSSPLSVRCAVVLGVLILGGLLLTRALLSLRPRRAAAASFVKDTGGVATIEFALLVPILLFVMLMLAQTTLLMGGNIFVHYSAFAAARTAIVQIPADYAGEPANTYVNAAGSAKHQAIFCSAVFALVPVAGSTPGGPSGGAAPPVSADAFTQAVAQFYTGYGQTPPPWVTKLIGPRLAYAAANTTVTVLKPVVDNMQVSYEEVGGTIDPYDPITVRVDHQLNLSVPYVNRIFADGSNGGVQRYTRVSAQATLTNEGIPDRFPPLPDLPRIP